jgi:GAF domain-containing protein
MTAERIDWLFGGGGAAPLLLVESYWPGVDAGQVEALAQRLRAASSPVAGGDVRFLGSILVPSDETVFSFFEGEEADVRALGARAGVPLDRIRESLRLSGREPASGGPR